MIHPTASGPKVLQNDQIDGSDIGTSVPSPTLTREHLEPGHAADDSLPELRMSSITAGDNKKVYIIHTAIKTKAIQQSATKKKVWQLRH